MGEQELPAHNPNSRTAKGNNPVNARRSGGDEMSAAEKFLKYGLWAVLLVLLCCCCGFFKGWKLLKGWKHC